MFSILVLIAAGLVVLTYNGVFTDKDKDGIPDTIEDKAKEVKSKIFKKKKWKSQKLANVETLQIQTDIVTVLI